MSNTNPTVPKRGEIWLVRFDPTIGSEIRKTRPAIVLSSDAVGRLPITTHVGPYEESMVKEAIQKELDRKGQVFYVHNRVQSLNTRLHFLKELLPGVSIGVRSLGSDNPDPPGSTDADWSRNRWSRIRVELE